MRRKMTFEEKRKRKRTSVVDKNTASKTAVFILETFLLQLSGCLSKAPFLSLFFALLHISATITKFVVADTVIIEIRENV